MDSKPDVTFAVSEQSEDSSQANEEALEKGEHSWQDKAIYSEACSSASSSNEDADATEHVPVHWDNHNNTSMRSVVFEDVYGELQDISTRLKIENKLLQEREMRLKTREEEIERAYKKLAHVVHQSADQKCSQVEMKAREKIGLLSSQLRDKCKENKRLRGNFDALRQANDELKKQLETLQAQHETLEKQANSLKQRLENMQRKQEYKDKQTEDILSELKPKLEAKSAATAVSQCRKKTAGKQAAPAAAALYDALSLSLEWIVRDVLAPSCSRGATLDTALRLRIVDSSQQIIPTLVERLKDDREAAPKKIGLPSLQFVYWGCLLADHGHGKQNTAFLATLRHLSEELYRPLLHNGRAELTSSCERSDTFDSARDGNRLRLVFVRSPDLHVRLLSCLLLLKTLNQVDFIANTFDFLKTELKEERSKELFVYYQGTCVLLQYFKPTAKVHLSAVLDVCMLLAVESTMSAAFLESCSCEAWFRSCAMVLKIPNLDERLLEKMSVVLQKLSKIKANRKHFETFQLKGILQEMMRSVSSDSGSFMVLNCKSILFNLS